MHNNITWLVIAAAAFAGNFFVTAVYKKKCENYSSEILQKLKLRFFCCSGQNADYFCVINNNSLKGFEKIGRKESTCEKL